MDECEKGFLLVQMGIEFGTRAKVKEGKQIIEMDWSEFQNLAAIFYELGKESVDAKQAFDINETEA